MINLEKYTEPEKNSTALKDTVEEVEAHTSKGTKHGSQATSGSRKKRKGSKDTGEEVLILTEDDLNEISNTATSAIVGARPHECNFGYIFGMF